MIVSVDESLIVSSLGWCDGGSVWVLDARRGRVTMHPISDAKYLSLHAGTNGYFSVVHHYEADRLCISAHSLADPANVVARAIFDASGNVCEGDDSIWSHLPRTYVAYFKRPSISDFQLFWIDPIRPVAEIRGCPGCR